MPHFFLSISQALAKLNSISRIFINVSTLIKTEWWLNAEIWLNPIMSHGCTDKEAKRKREEYCVNLVSFQDVETVKV
jgi:hypothetical protein